MENNTNVIIEEIRKRFSHDKQTMDDLELFLKTKAAYMLDESIENRLEMKMAYVNIYEDVKMGWVGRRYAENTFRRYVSALKDLSDKGFPEQYRPVD